MGNIDKVIEVVKKWGVTGCLVLALFWMNSRLNGLEEKLYDCYEKRVLHAYNIDDTYELVADKPKPIKIVKA